MEIILKANRDYPMISEMGQVSIIGLRTHILSMFSTTTVMLLPHMKFSTEIGGGVWSIHGTEKPVIIYLEIIGVSFYQIKKTLKNTKMKIKFISIISFIGILYSTYGFDSKIDSFLNDVTNAVDSRSKTSITELFLPEEDQDVKDRSANLIISLTDDISYSFAFAQPIYSAHNKKHSDEKYKVVGTVSLINGGNIITTIPCVKTELGFFLKSFSRGNTNSDGLTKFVMEIANTEGKDVSLSGHAIISINGDLKLIILDGKEEFLASDLLFIKGSLNAKKENCSVSIDVISENGEHKEKIHYKNEGVSAPNFVIK